MQSLGVPESAKRTPQAATKPEREAWDTALLTFAPKHFRQARGRSRLTNYAERRK